MTVGQETYEVVAEQVTPLGECLVTLPTGKRWVPSSWVAA